MLESRSLLVSIYLVLLVCVFARALLIGLSCFQQAKNHEQESRQGDNYFVALMLASAIILSIAHGIPNMLSPVVLSLVLVVPLEGKRAFMVGLSALPLLAGVVWWDRSVSLSPGRALIFLSIGIFTAALPRILPRRGRLPLGATLLTLGGLGFAACLPMGVYATGGSLGGIWHHWGAYVAPADALVAGGLPYRDFPVQYGMIPTLLIASFCHEGDCWQSVYYLVSLSNIAYLLCMGGCAVLLTRRFSIGASIVSLGAVIASVLFWTAYPPNFMSWMVSPSVGGLRFLPLASIVLHIMLCESRGEPIDWRGHALWLTGLAWSPEAAFQVSLVWWPYLIIRRATKESEMLPKILILASGTLSTIFALIGGLVILILAFRLGFGNWPSLAGFLTYVRNPPGILSPNLAGPVWLLVATTIGGFHALSQFDRQRQRECFVCMAALLGASSYYLGRSHDNNVLNLFPFMVLALLPLLGLPKNSPISALSKTILAGLLAYIPTFGFGSWKEAHRLGYTTIMGPERLLAEIKLDTPQAQAKLDLSSPQKPPAGRMRDAGEALAWLRKRGEGPPLFVTPHYLQIRGMNGPGWTGMSNLATYGLLPHEVVVKFIRNGAQAYDKPGWILIDKAYPGTWLEAFTSAYDIETKEQFGGFMAYKVRPK
jgi:hypothetical protein